MLGVGALRKAWHALTQTKAEAPVSTVQGVPPPLPSWQPDEATRQINRVFRVWIVIYALVGCQMAWVLRPFILDPHGKFGWFRARHANFFIDVWNTIWNLLK